jgi:hypothetical protein
VEALLATVCDRQTSPMSSVHAFDFCDVTVTALICRNAQ